MNYLPFCGYWFFCGADVTKISVPFASYGLLMSVGVEVVAKFIRRRKTFYKQ